MRSHRFLLGLPLLFLVAFLTALQSPAAYECSRCPRRSVAVFAVAVPPITQDAMLSYGDWYDMHLVGGGVYGALFNDDPSADCLDFIEAQMAVQGSATGQAFQHGMGDMAAPAGSISHADYIITGAIAIPLLDRGYAISLSVQAAGSREVVATATGPYDASTGGLASGRQVARQLMPLMEKIRDFEKRKRSESPAVAIDVDEGMTITPARDFIKTHDTVKVKYRLEDCDGEALNGRIFAPFATLGRLDVKQTPQTDDNGELELEFIAGGQTGTAQLRVEFPYVQPFGHEDTGGGVGRIHIVDHALWASVKVYREEHMNRDDEEDGHIVKQNNHSSRAFSVYMYFEDKPFRVYYADNSLTPIRFKHRLAGIVPGRFNYTHAGSSYEARRSMAGLDWEITASYSSMAQEGPTDLYQKDADYVTYEIDPKSKVVTHVTLPVLDMHYTVTINRRCQKKDHYRHTTNDCSDTWSHAETVSTTTPAEPQCEEIAVTGPTMVSGRCRIPQSGKYHTSTTDYEWEFHRE